MRYELIKTDDTCGIDERRAYFEGILKLIDDKAQEALRLRDSFITPTKLCADREGYRKKYLDMLGTPLSEYTHEYAPNVKKYTVENTGELKISRLCIETLPGVWFEGLIYEPAEHDEKAPLVIINPGGSYCSEDLIAHGTFDNGQYKNIGGRIVERGAILYAPQFLLWCDSEAEKYGMHQPQTRQLLDAKLKSLGSSIAAVEIYNVRRAIDYFIANEPIDSERIGMIGLSYGGFYALYIAAAETRIKSTFSSCFFCDRFCSDRSADGCRSDWLWQDSALTFFDAEVAALIAPRALYIENGLNDTLFPEGSVRSESERLKPFYYAANAADKLKLFLGDNGHEISSGDIGFDFFVSNLF